MQIRGVNRNNGKEIIAKLREKPAIKLKKKPSVPNNMNPRRVA